MTKSVLVGVLLAVVLLAADLGGAQVAARPSSGSSAQQDAMLNCPQPGKWAISVWSGQDDTDAEQAFATCGEGAVAAAYHIDPDTQMWSRWFADRPEVSNLTTLNQLQGVLALGGANAPIPAPSGSSVQRNVMDNCPQLGKWAIAVWEGRDGMDTDEALGDCLAPEVEAAYYIDPQTQDWLRWFQGQPEVSDLATLNHLQGVIAMAPPATTQANPTPPPNAKYIPPSELWPAVDYTEDGWPIVADELIVKFRDGVSEEEKEAILAEVGAQSKGIYEYSDICVVKVDPAQREQILKELSSNENIEIVEPNPIPQPAISE